MSKKRTKKQKEKAQHRFTSNLKTGSTTFRFEPSVNSQTDSAFNKEINEPNNSASAKYSAKDSDLSTIRKNIFKSLILSSLILSTELVIYLIWK